MENLLRLRSITRIKDSTLVLATIALIASCGRIESDSQIQERIDSSPTVEQVDAALNAGLAVRINLKSNRATLYENGTPKSQWNVASGDVTGQNHGGVPQFTPQGIYSIELMENCPIWRPQDPVWPSTGAIAANEAERQEIFRRYPETYGPCGASNPLGQYVMWFYGAFGMHGNANETVLNRPNPESRRVSGGCVRNPNKVAQKLFHEILEHNGLTTFQNTVRSNERLPQSQRRLKSQFVSGLDTRVVIGRWSSDPELPTPQPEPQPQPQPEPQPQPQPTPIDETLETLSAREDSVLVTAEIRAARIYRSTEPIVINGQVKAFVGPYRVVLKDNSGVEFDDSLINVSTGKFQLSATSLKVGKHDNLRIEVQSRMRDSLVAIPISIEVIAR